MKVLALVVIVGMGAAATLYWYVSTRDDREPSLLAWGEHCAHCHGTALQGTPDGPALAGRDLSGGDSTEALLESMKGVPGHGLLLSDAGLSEPMVKALALYIGERRQQFPGTEDSYSANLATRELRTRHQAIRVETFARLASRPYSMAPLPDGSLLVSEKVRGLSIVDSSGRQGPLITGTPRVWEHLAEFEQSWVGLGMMLEVALHPDFARNGWIYLSHSDRCQWDCGSPWPVSMVRVVRGRIDQGRWVDEEEIWRVHEDYYTVVPDTVAAGRLAFDRDGHLYVSVGGKAPYGKLHDMDTPYGKTHRVRDDGSVPRDNPFWAAEGERPPSSTRHTVWSYGHRTIQGLEGDPVSGEVWSTEMGPRGGDEVNRIIGGGNYGWPLYTNGLDYNAEPIRIGEDLGLDFSFEDTVPPVLDLTPAPAISNLTFYHGDAFPAWTGDLLVGSLKARTVYRVRVRDGLATEVEKLVSDLGRVRDIEIGYDGLVYVLLEHGPDGSVVRLSPVAAED